MVACAGDLATLRVQDIEPAALQKRAQVLQGPVVGRDDRVRERLDPVPGEEPDEQAPSRLETVSQGRQRSGQLLRRDVNEGVPGQDGTIGDRGQTEEPCR